MEPLTRFKHIIIYLEDRCGYMNREMNNNEPVAQKTMGDIGTLFNLLLIWSFPL